MGAQGGAKRDRLLATRAKGAIARLGGRVIGGPKSTGDARLVRDAMTRRVVTIDPDAPISRAAERLAEQDVGVLAVCGADRRPNAVITDRDIVVRAVAQGFDPEKLTVGECGTDELVTVSPGETLGQAGRRMDEQQVRRLPVVQEGRLVGIVSQSDLAAGGARKEAGRLLAGMARKGGDRRSAGWVLRRPYRAVDDPTSNSIAVASLVETPPSVYLAGIVIGVVLAALVLLELGPPL